MSQPLSNTDMDLYPSPQSLPLFKDYLFKDPTNATILKLVSLAVPIQFFIFKLLYPNAGFINGDSYNYIEAAFWNVSINTYMIGYSLFLRIFSAFTYSDTALVAFQYLSAQCSALFLLFTIFYFYRPAKTIRIILSGFMILNPLFLYMSNYVSSDVLFLALSHVWFALLIWIIHRPSIKLIGWHTLVIFLAFTFRYNALSYPFIAILPFCLSYNLALRTKLIGIAAAFLAVGLFMAKTANDYKKLTGAWQYSPFSGWLLANNAMYAYRYVDSMEHKPVPEKYRQLDNTIRAYFDTTRDLKKHPDESMMASTVYMWDPHSPLYRYRDWIFKDSTTTEFKKWASMGPLYSEYGSYIIKQYPGKFARYFLWPNLNKYYATPVEFLDRYNSGDDTVANIAQWWFQWQTNKVKTAFKDRHVHALDYYPILAGMMNVIFLTGLVCFYKFKGFKNSPAFSKGILIIATIWVINMGFTVFASSAALRFQTFPLLIFSCFAILLFDYILKTIAAKPQSDTNSLVTHNNEP